ncbi:hypothetical protein GCM10022206_28090 [Streptomyces chiangmaiensis]
MRPDVTDAELNELFGASWPAGRPTSFTRCRPGVWRGSRNVEGDLLARSDHSVELVQESSNGHRVIAADWAPGDGRPMGGLQLGGDLNDCRHLWAEPADPGHQPGAGVNNNEMDPVETKLHTAVCAGQVTHYDEPVQWHPAATVPGRRALPSSAALCGHSFEGSIVAWGGLRKRTPWLSGAPGWSDCCPPSFGVGDVSRSLS